MAMLGDVLGAARRSSGEFLRWLESADPALARRVAAMAGWRGESAAGYVRAAVAEFDRAPAEDWAAVTSKLREAERPGAACLSIMVERRLASDEAARRAEGDFR